MRLRSAMRRRMVALGHRVRRTLARYRLGRIFHRWRQADHTPSILVLCVGNMCRSPYVGALLEDRLSGPTPRVDTAGFVGEGRSPPQPALELAARRSLDLSAHRSQSVTWESIRRADLILVTDPLQAQWLRAFGPLGSRPVCVLGDLDPHIPDSRAIPDPIGQDPDIYELSFARIDRCVSVIGELWSKHSP